MRRAAFGVVAGIATGASPAAACTLCHSSAGDAIRMAMLGPDFWPGLAALAAPAPILVAAVLLVRRNLP